MVQCTHRGIVFRWEGSQKPFKYNLLKFFSIDKVVGTADVVDGASRDIIPASGSAFRRIGTTI